MKKTFITLLALAGVAMGETATYSPLTSTVGWTLGDSHTAKDGTPSINTTDGTLNGATIWARSSAIYDVQDITLSDEGDSLTVSFTITAGNTNTLLTGALIGNDKAIVLGHGGYSDEGKADAIQYGTTSSDEGIWYNMQKEGSAMNNPSEGIVYVSTHGNTTGIFSANTPLTLTTSIKWDNAKSQFVATLCYGEGANSSTLTSYDLGASYTLEKLVFSQDGADYQTISNLTIVETQAAPSSNVPEPATATLSLLALAGLAARRRRH